ncbi:MAG: 2-hydroxyacid dehydrogenase [Myxococcaceae bacterium]
MKIAFFDTHRFDREAFEAANQGFGFDISWLEPRLTEPTAILAAGHDAVCAFVNDRLDAPTLEILAKQGIRIVLLRSAGYNNVDLPAAGRLGITVMRVPEYSPWAVAEHTVALLLMLNRHLHRASARVREMNFSLEGLVGFDLRGKTVGIIGTGRIGTATANIFLGFGCKVIAFDPKRNPDLEQRGVRYVSLDELYAQSDVVSLHVPLMPATHHLLNAQAFAKMKRGVFIVNTSRGALIDSRALVEALKSQHIGGAALDVYEEEEGLFFRDLSDQVIQDDVLARLLTFPNVVITAHQAFLTHEALHNIAETTLGNLKVFIETGEARNEVRAEQVIRA